MPWKQKVNWQFLVMALNYQQKLKLFSSATATHWQNSEFLQLYFIPFKSNHLVNKRRKYNFMSVSSVQFKR